MTSVELQALLTGAAAHGVTVERHGDQIDIVSDGGDPAAGALEDRLRDAAAELRAFLPDLGPRAASRNGRARARPDAADGAGEPSPEAWEPPIPLDRDPDPPAFPTAALPAVIRAMVEAVAEALQVPVDAPAVLALAVLAIATARPLVCVRAAPDWREPLNLYVAVAMEAGERKSGTIRELTAPMAAYERAELEKAQPAIAAAASARRQAELRVDRVEKAAAGAEGAQRAQNEAKARDAVEARDRIDVPPEPRRFTADVTMEKLASLLAAHGGRFAVVSAEGGIFDLMAGLYTKGQPNPDVVLKAHAGDTIRVDRGSRPAEYVDRPALTLCLTVQPSSLAAIRKNPALRHRGLLERLLLAVPRGRIGMRSVDATPVPDAVRTAYGDLVTRLARSIDGQTEPLTLTLSPGAAGVLSAWRATHEPRCGPDGDLAEIKGWASKLPGAAVRITGLLHLAAQLDRGYGAPISEPTIRGAVAIAEYFTAHALRAFGLMDADPRVPDAQVLLDWLRREPRRRFTRREAHRALHRRFPAVAPLAGACALLEEHGYLRIVEAIGHPGRPSSAYDVHPDLANGPPGATL